LQPTLQTQGSSSQEAKTWPMPEPRAQRTLVKSPPEIWAEVSDVSALARHLGEFGEIRITRLEAETTVVWEGDRARGTVELEASGWGTKVTITAAAIATDEVEEVEEVTAEVVPVAIEAVVEEEAAPAEAVVVKEDVEPEAAPAPEVEAEREAEAPIAAPRRGFFARLLRRRRTAEPTAIKQPAAVAIREAGPEPAPVEPEAIEIPEAPAIAEPDLDGEIAAGAAAGTPALGPGQVEAVLVGVLDDLGSAHHRPFSRG
jgi:hypothetical protein